MRPPVARAATRTTVAYRSSSSTRSGAGAASEEQVHPALVPERERPAGARDYAALAIVDLDLTGSAPIKPTLPAADILPDAGTPGAERI